MKRSAFVLLTLSLGCAQRERYDKPGQGLDQALFYTEQPRRQDARPVSGADAAKDVEAVPKPGLVDVDSRLAIQVRKERILSGDAGDPALARAVQQLELREREVLAVIRSLQAFVETKRETLALYAETERLPAAPEALTRFDEKKKQLSRETRALVGGIQSLFPRDSQTYADLALAIEKRPKDGLEPARPFLNEELRSIDVRQEALAAQVRGHHLSLRLEAFLSSGELDPEAIHLEHYDDLDQGKVQRRDPFGLDLGPKELERLAELMATSRRLADSLNAVRRGERSLEQLFTDAAGGLMGRIGELVREILALYEDAKAAKAALEDLAKDLKEFGVTAAGILEGAAETALGEALKSLDGSLAKLAAVVVRLVELRDAWTNRGSDSLPELLTAAPALAGDLQHLIDAFSTPEGRKTLRMEAEAVVEAAAQAAGNAAGPALRKAWLESKARPKVEKLTTLAQKVLEAAEGLVRALGTKEAAPLSDGVRNTSAFQVPVDKLKDTAIELERTSRKAGDLVQVRATLYRGQEEIDRSSASFELREFGWHAELAPAVVLARPYRRESTGDEDFNFAPSLSWMLRYTPRPQQSDLYAPLRFLDLSFGPHATFLNFDSEKEVEIGLGGTVGLWDDLIIGGAGWNLMADETDEGGTYFFVGSSLIAWLQKLGVAE